jgi:tetratricopeptide (TPR) repeat protein
MTDDRPFIEFSAPRNLILPVNRMWMQNLEELLRRRVPILPFIENADDSTVGSINRCALASSLFMNAALFNAQNDFFQACVAVDSALGLMPGDTTAKMLKADAGENALTLCLNRARTCRQKGVFPCAEQAYLRALAVDSLCAVARTELTTLYNSAGMFEKGLEQALKAAASLPNDPATHTNLAVVYMNLNRPAEAESSLVRAIAVDKTYERAHFFLGQLYKETGKIKNPDASEHF